MARRNVGEVMVRGSPPQRHAAASPLLPFTRPLLLDMATEYDDVLTNQPVVIDNVRSYAYV
jgi:hypothetical protein